MRNHGFSPNGNRTNHQVAIHPDGDCASTTGTTTSYTYAYDAADRPTTTAAKDGAAPTGSYTYDLGRQTLLPAADAPDPAKGQVTLGHYDNDLARTIPQAGTTTTYTLDLTDRGTTSLTGPTGAASGAPGTTSTVRHYTDGGDNPAWTDTTTVDATGTTTAVTTRYVESLSGDLGAQIGSDGAATLTLANPHGDSVTTITIPAGQDAQTNAVTINGWADYTEYGAKTDTTSDAPAAAAGTIGYGWLGAKQRSTTPESAGLTLMGVRLYNPARSLFTSIDPVEGGNTTAYAYPQDSINAYDLDGRALGLGEGGRGGAFSTTGLISARQMAAYRARIGSTARNREISVRLLAFAYRIEAPHRQGGIGGIGTSSMKSMPPVVPHTSMGFLGRLGFEGAVRGRLRGQMRGSGGVTHTSKRTAVALGSGNESSDGFPQECGKRHTFMATTHGIVGSFHRGTVMEYD